MTDQDTKTPPELSPEEAFRRAADEDFVKRLSAYVAEHYPSQVTAAGGKDALPDLARAGMAAARGYGITGEYDLARYVILTLILGKGFATDSRYPWAAGILADPLLPATTKLDRLWAEAEQALGDKFPKT